MVKMEDIIVVKKRNIGAEHETKQVSRDFRSAPSEGEVERCVEKLSQELKAPYHQASNLADKLYKNGVITQREWDKFIRAIMEAYQHCSRLLEMFKGYEFASYNQFDSMKSTVETAASLMEDQFNKNIVAELKAKIKNNPEDDFIQ